MARQQAITSRIKHPLEPRPSHSNYRFFVTDYITGWLPSLNYSKSAAEITARQAQ